MELAAVTLYTVWLSIAESRRPTTSYDSLEDALGLRVEAASRAARAQEVGPAPCGLPRPRDDATTDSAVRLVCPICNRELDVPEDAEMRPFCSARCKKVDLYNWLNGNYRIPGPVESSEAEDELPAEGWSPTIQAGRGRSSS